jgi:hypothetical protein
MSCKIPYIEQQFRDVNPSLADTLNTKYSQIWDSVIESELFKKEDDTSKYLMATTNISRLQEQQDFIDKINQDNSVPEGASVIENLNGYVNVNVLNLPEVTGVSTSTIKEGVEELFNENPELYLETIFPDSKVKDIVYHTNTRGRIETFNSEKGLFVTPTLELAKTYKPGLNGKRFQLLINAKKIDEVSEETIMDGKKQSGDTLMYSEPDYTEYVVFEPEQIHILGSKQDIEGFKEFVNKQPKPTIDYTSLDVTASLDAETKAKIDYLRNNDDLTVQC